MPGRKSAYVIAMEEARKADREKKKSGRGTKRQANVVGYCGANKAKRGGTCRNPAGFRTDHHGIGRCHLHGGRTSGQRKNAASQEAMLMGAPVDINPLDALIWCIKITAGEVEFCNSQMEALPQDEWLESTILGKQLHMWARERQKAVDRLAKFSERALALGIAERAVRMAEQYGHTIARYTKGLLNDLQLTADQLEIAPLVVRKHLALMENNAPIQDEDRTRLPDIPGRSRVVDNVAEGVVGKVRKG